MSDFFMSKYNTLELDTALRIGTSFDLIKRKIRVADRVAYLYYIDEFSKDELNCNSVEEQENMSSISMILPRMSCLIIQLNLLITIFLILR